MAILHDLASALTTFVVGCYVAGFVGYAAVTPLAMAIAPHSLIGRNVRLSAVLVGHGHGLTQWLRAVVSTTYGAAAWPVAMFANLRRGWHEVETSAIAMADVTLRPLDIAVAAFNLGLMTFVIATTALQLGWYPLQLATALIILVGIFIRLLVYFVVPFIERLRKSSLDPVVNLLLVMAADGLTLILGIAAIFESPKPLHPSVNSFRLAAVDLLTATLGSIQWDKLASLAPSRLITILFSLLFYVTLVKTALSRKEFVRTDDDVRSVAMNAVVHGNYPKARKWLNMESNSTPASFNVRAAIDLGTLNFDTALADVRQGRRARGNDESLDEACTALWGLSLAIQWTPGNRVSFIAREIQWGAADVEVCRQINSCFVADLATFDSLASGLWAACDERRYPLARCAFLREAGRVTDVVDILNRARPTLPIEQLQQIIWLCEATFVQLPDSDQQAAYLRRWSVAMIPKINAMCHNLQTPWRGEGMRSVVWFGFRVVSLDRGLADQLIQLAKTLEDEEGQFD